MKLYNSIKRPDNYNKFDEPFVVGDKIQIQEKIDGSNTAIYKDNGKLRFFSRTREIINADDEFKNFVNYIKLFEDKILEILPEQYVIFGEWLGQAKISYNKKAKKGKICPYYVFDIAYKIENMDNQDLIKRHYLTPVVAQEYASKIGLQFVPIIEESLTLNTFDELIEKYVENKKSLIDDNSIREGIVIKTKDGVKRVKIVATQFSENSHKKVEVKSNQYEWLDKFITPMRIQKFLMKVKEKENISNITKDEYKLVFKNLDLLSEDIIEEEIEDILKNVSKIIKKDSTSIIKEVLENEDNNE